MDNTFDWPIWFVEKENLETKCRTGYSIIVPKFNIQRHLALYTVSLFLHLKR
jgi:hypothetical protein